MIGSSSQWATRQVFWSWHLLIQAHRTSSSVGKTCTTWVRSWLHVPPTANFTGGHHTNIYLCFGPKVVLGVARSMVLSQALTLPLGQPCRALAKSHHHQITRATSALPFWGQRILQRLQPRQGLRRPCAGSTTFPNTKVWLLVHAFQAL